MTSAAVVSPIPFTPQIEPANFLNLLIVDDERSVREACREVAHSLGFSAHVADSAEQAHRMLDLQPFDAVLLDLRRPGAGGLEALRRIRSQETHWAQTLQQAATRLREQSYSVAVIDQFVLETEPEESDQVLEHLGTAYPVYVNFALTGMERMLREVRFALHRREREESSARRAIAEQMNCEMRETLTAMLLSCELAMSVPDVPMLAAEKIRTIDNLARELRLRLEVN